MKKTPLKAKQSNLKKTPLKSKNNRLRANSSLKQTNFLKVKGFLLKVTPGKGLTKTELKNNGNELKKQNDKAKEKWQEIRQKVLERDGGKCVICGKPATHVHHIHLRSKRKDLLYNMNNLVSLCSHDHRHQSTEGLEQVNMRIAKALHMTLEELLRFAETKENDNV